MTAAATHDRRQRGETVRERRAFNRVRRAETEFGRRLRAVAGHVGEIVSGLFDDKWTPESRRIENALRKYADLLHGWAEATSAAMIADVQRRDETVWSSLGKEMGLALRQEVREAPTGEVMRALLAEQVVLITSLPREAADRVHQLTLAAQEGGVRAREVAKEIMRTGEVTKSRANLIARTEVARTASALVQARAEYVGSEGYIWRTAEDSDVRKRHQQLEGKFIRWDDPPVSGERGERAHAGMIYNCRCYPEPVVPSFRAEAA